jgi:hypothetical protein
VAVGNGLVVAGGRLDGGAGAVGLAYCDLRGVHMGARGPDMRAGGAFDAVGVCVDWTGSGHARRRFRLGGYAHMAVVSWKWRGADRVRKPCWRSLVTLTVRVDGRERGGTGQ